MRTAAEMEKALVKSTPTVESADDTLYDTEYIPTQAFVKKYATIYLSAELFIHQHIEFGIKGSEYDSILLRVANSNFEGEIMYFQNFM